MIIPKNISVTFVRPVLFVGFTGCLDLSKVLFLVTAIAGFVSVLVVISNVFVYITNNSEKFSVICWYNFMFVIIYVNFIDPNFLFSYDHITIYKVGNWGNFWTQLAPKYSTILESDYNIPQFSACQSSF